jgi:hypothetical protein
LCIVEFAINPSWNDETFSEYVHHVREEMVQWRGKFPFWSTIKDSAILPGGVEIWYGDPPYYLKLIGAPGTLAGDILRLKSDLPRYHGDLEIIGDDFHDTERKPTGMKRLTPISRTARKLPNYPSSHSTPEAFCQVSDIQARGPLLAAVPGFPPRRAAVGKDGRRGPRFSQV